MMSNYILAIILIASYGFDCANAIQYTNNITEVIESLLNNYDKIVRPNFGGASVDVEVSMFVISFNAVSDIDMDYTINIYFRQYWNDPRLSFDKAGLQNLNLPYEFVNMIWIPDTFFVNDKESSLHVITTKNGFIRVDRNGTVTKSVRCLLLNKYNWSEARESPYAVTRLSVRASCPMNFRTYPMDKQVCSLNMESYGYNSKDIKYSWKKPGNAIGVATDLTMGSQFNLVGFTENSEHIQLSTGNYSRLKVNFEFVRTKGYYFLQIYIPFTMLVILAWISFWFNNKASNCRLVFCSLALLLAVVGCQTLSTQIPKTSYTKAVDVFAGSCLTFVFVALLECAYILNNYTKNGKDDINDGLSKMNRFFLIGYPIAFFAFNILYWAVYLSI